MKRARTACEGMIQDFKGLRELGIADFFCTTFAANGRRYATVVRHTANGVSAYANRMLEKYGDGTEVEVVYFDTDCRWTLYCTYGA